MGKTVSGSLIGEMDDNGSWVLKQDISSYVKAAKEEKKFFEENNWLKPKHHMRKFATIPDIIAIEIMQKFGLDIHHPSFQSSKEDKKKLRDIIINHYPYLMTSTS